MGDNTFVVVFLIVVRYAIYGFLDNVAAPFNVSVMSSRRAEKYND